MHERNRGCEGCSSINSGRLHRFAYPAYLCSSPFGMVLQTIPLLVSFNPSVSPPRRQSACLLLPSLQVSPGPRLAACAAGVPGSSECEVAPPPHPWSAMLGDYIASQA